MKTKDFLKKYAVARSVADVQVHVYYNGKPGESEMFGLTRFEVKHFGEMEWPLAKSTLESFEIVNDVEGRPMLRVNVSI